MRDNLRLFLMGVGRTLDVFGVLGMPRRLDAMTISKATGKPVDQIELALDWWRVGKDIQSAMTVWREAEIDDALSEEGTQGTEQAARG